MAHLLVHEPPQSTSVSVPFFTPSLQAGAVQTRLVHFPLVQSVFCVQGWPSAQGPQSIPPQSMPVSFVSFTMLVQLASTETCAPLQMPLTQSVLAAQSIPLAHLLAQEPADSRS